MKRLGVFLYGSVCYLIFFATFLYAIGFLNNILVPKSMDSGEPGPFGTALLVNAALLGLFAIQHSVMARPGFKKWWTRFVPQSMERSTYVLLSCVALGLLFWFWQPMQGVIWNVQGEIGRAILYGVYALGLVTVFISTCLINHFDLFGLRQVWHHLRGKDCPPLEVKSPGLYKLVRHPVYVGWLLTFWGAPMMSVAHLVFAVGTTLYILVAIQLEERDLVAEHGEAYESYRRGTPMLVPMPMPKLSGFARGNVSRAAG